MPLQLRHLGERPRAIFCFDESVNPSHLMFDIVLQVNSPTQCGHALLVKPVVSDAAIEPIVMPST
jgi:hypothetical protein